MDIAPILAHLLIGLFFIIFGVTTFFQRNNTLSILRQKKLPFPSLVLGLGILWSIMTGFMIMTGMYVQLAALSLIPFTIIFAWIFRQPKTSLSLFFANSTATVGALLLLISR